MFQRKHYIVRRSVKRTKDEFGTKKNWHGSYNVMTKSTEYSALASTSTFTSYTFTLESLLEIYELWSPSYVVGEKRLTSNWGKINTSGVDNNESRKTRESGKRSL